MPWKTTEIMDQKIEFSLRAIKGENFRALCREYEISRTTGYKWKQRFLEKGVSGMSEKSRRPKNSPGGLKEEQTCEIIRLKNNYPFWGPEKIQAVYRREKGNATPSLSSFKRVLERAGMVKKKRPRKNSDESGRIFSGRKAKASNEIWTIDFKGGWKNKYSEYHEPLTLRDEYSKFVFLIRDLTDLRTESVREAMEEIFGKYGLPQAIRSDNGSPFASNNGILGLSRLSAWWMALGIDLERGRPACPQDNGAHERFHGDISRELKTMKNDAQQSVYEEWRDQYNQVRPHQALGQKTPNEVYEKSKRRFEGTPEDFEYSGKEARKVMSRGGIKYRGNFIFISEALIGWSVGLAANEEDDFFLDVYFSSLLIGRLDMKGEKGVFLRVTEQSK